MIPTIKGAVECEEGLMEPNAGECEAVFKKGGVFPLPAMSDFCLLAQ